MKKIFDLKLIKFALVGTFNTLLSAIIMVVLYNFIHIGYWSSTAIAYIIGSVISFWLNKNFTFKNDESVIITGIKFIINILICYLIAFSLAKPIIIYLLKNLSLPVKTIELIAMLFGMPLFTCLNYLGQRFFAFKK